MCICYTIYTYIYHSENKKTVPGRGARAAPATCTTLLWIRALDFLMGPRYLASPAMGRWRNPWENPGEIHACFLSDMICFLLNMSD